MKNNKENTIWGYILLTPHWSQGKHIQDDLWDIKDEYIKCTCLSYIWEICKEQNGFRRFKRAKYSSKDI